MLRIHIAEFFGQESPMARSQAKRLVHRFDLFRHVILDFHEVEWIGQGFADEVFRVFRNRHQDVQLAVVRAEPAVRQMIQHICPHDTALFELDSL